jgi:signal transduction histidine kinase
VRSLRARLLFLMLTVLIAAGSLAAWLAGRAIAERFERYLISHQAASLERRQRLEELLPTLLATHYAQYEGWVGVDDLLDRFAGLAEERIILTDLQGQLLVDTDDAQFSGEPLVEPAPILLDGQAVGYLQIPPSPLIKNSSSERAYIAQVNRSLLIAFSVSGLVAVILTLGLTHGILRRIKALTTAVNRMEQGDLSQRVQNGEQDEIGQLAHAFNSMADSLAHIEQLRRHMVSDVAHELRTPLSNIRGYLEAVQDGVVQPTTAVIDSLHDEAMLLHRLVNDLQELALAEAGQLKLARQPIAVDELVEKAVQIVQGHINGSHVIHTEVTPGLPPIAVDAERIGQVLRNLLNNAVEYTPPGGKITVAARRVQDKIQVNVYNEGEGIPSEHLPNIFERFYRVDGSRTRATGGSGLGLAIVKQLVEAHGGRVWAESTPGVSANLIFTLPINAAP